MKLVALRFGAFVASFFFLLTIDHLLLTPSAGGFDRSNVPLKNWGGFAVSRSWIYDALEKVVLAGLAEEALLNTKPISRVEAATIVAQAVRRIREDQYGDYNHRGYLEELLYGLVEEFGPELAEMGVRTPLNRDDPPGFWRFTPVDHAQFSSSFASQRSRGNFGRTNNKGGNSSTSMDGRIQVGDFLSFYYQPEFFWNSDSAQARLLRGYGKLTLWNLELMAGRESLWWGPGYRGSMTLSNNAFPLDQVQLTLAEPIRLPWVLKVLGPVKTSLFIGQLEENRQVSRAKVGGWRLNLAPSRYFEFGFSRMFMFGGGGRGTIHPGEFLRLLFDQGSDDPDSRINVNNIMSFDATVRFPEIGRYILIARDAALYFDFGWDDTLFGLIVPDRPGGIVGTYLTGLFGDPKLDFRFEYAQTSDIQFRHGIYRDGFTNRGSVLSHFIGTGGREIYGRISRWVSPDILVGLNLSLAEIGSTSLNPSTTPREERNSFGFDISYRLSNKSSLYMAYDFAKVENREFKSGKDGNDVLFRIDFTRKFDWQ